jgi:hypothetical protein
MVIPIKLLEELLKQLKLLTYKFKTLKLLIPS